VIKKNVEVNLTSIAKRLQSDCKASAKRLQNSRAKLIANQPQAIQSDRKAIKKRLKCDDSKSIAEQLQSDSKARFQIDCIAIAKQLLCTIPKQSQSSYKAIAKRLQSDDSKAIAEQLQSNCCRGIKKRLEIDWKATEKRLKSDWSLQSKSDCFAMIPKQSQSNDSKSSAEQLQSDRKAMIP
jgi:O6-methylguanine-DNA--protein-cysteine methyltransferase